MPLSFCLGRMFFLHVFSNIQVSPQKKLFKTADLMMAVMPKACLWFFLLDHKTIYFWHVIDHFHKYIDNHVLNHANYPHPLYKCFQCFVPKFSMNDTHVLLSLKRFGCKLGMKRTIATHQIWARSAEPLPSYSTVKFYDIPSLCTCHALHSSRYTFSGGRDV